MKTLRSVLLCTVVVAIAGVSCEDTAGTDSPTRTTDRTDTTDVDFPNLEMGGIRPHSHAVSLSFVDFEGNDLVKGIDGTEPESSINSNFVAPDQYTLTSSPSLYELGHFSNPTAIYDDPHPFPRLGFTPSDFQDEWEDVWDEDYFRSVYTEEEYDNRMQHVYDSWMENQNARNGHNLVSVRMSTLSDDTKLGEITYTLTLPHIFGDSDAHEIVTYWCDPSTGPSYYSVCYKVEIDGKEFTDIAYANYQQMSVATIVLDR